MSAFIFIDTGPKRDLTKVSSRFLWGMGFRPFFWGGALAAIFLVAAWAWFYGKGSPPHALFVAQFWHGHEMVYGFVAAIVAGFLLTASANWTRTRGVHGRALKYLFFLWAAGRLSLFASLWMSGLAFVSSLVDLAFIPAVIGVLAPPLVRSRVPRNLIFIPLLTLFWVGNLLMHLSAFELISMQYLRTGLYLGVNLIMALVIIIGGRVIPFFTQNALPEAKVRKSKVIEIVVFGLLAAYIFCDLLFPLETHVTGALALVLGISSLLRLALWQPQKTLGNALLLILHLGYFWVGIGFILIGASYLWHLLPISVALHALTVGAMGILIIGMISRVSLGHSGRLLQLEKNMLFSYLAINLSVVVRVAAAFWPQFYHTAIYVSAGFWVLAFVILLVYYTKIYWTPRADGREG